EREHLIAARYPDVIGTDGGARRHHHDAEIPDLVGAHQLAHDGRGAEGVLGPGLGRHDANATEDKLVVDRAAQPLHTILDAADGGVVRQAPHDRAAVDIEAE